MNSRRVHGPVPPVVPTEKIAHSNGRRLLHCGISTRLMTATGQTRSWGHVGSMSGLPESGNGWAINGYAS
jgi:hypothetical protein